MTLELFSSAQYCYSLSILFVAVWGCLSAAEWLRNVRHFSEQGLLAWSVVGLRYGPINRSLIFRILATPSCVSLVLFARFAAAAALPFLEHIGWQCICLGIILLSCPYITHRTCFGGDGSDQMGAILTAGTLLSGIGMLVSDHDLTNAGMLMIAGQATISYFIAGAAKAVSPVWRSGAALPGVMNTQTYGSSAAARVASGSQGFASFLCLLIILTEMAFPILLIAPQPILLLSLTGFAAFHVSNGIFMGLNSFIVTFIGTYPSVIYLNLLIRQSLSL